MPAADKARVFRDWRYSLFSGVTLALHFGSWVWSLQHTSLAHSLLLVSTTPIILVGHSLITRQPISLGEVAGALLAVAGCAVLASGAVSATETEATLLGDLAAFAAAVAVVAHWQAGKHLRTYQPVFVYSAPVTAFAAASLTVAGLAAEDRSIIGPNRHGIFGWVTSAHYAPVVVYLGAVPGVVGHQGFNTVLRYVSPLAVSLAVQFEPVVGPFLGWATGVSPAPGLYTYIGGSIMMVATIGATVASALRQQQEERLVKSKSLHMAVDVDGSLKAGDNGVAGAAAGGADTLFGPASYQRCSNEEQQLNLHHDTGQYMQRHQRGAVQPLRVLQSLRPGGHLLGAACEPERDLLLPHGSPSSAASHLDAQGAALGRAVFSLDNEDGDVAERAVLTAGGRVHGRLVGSDLTKQQHEIEMHVHAHVQKQ
eukprot:GHRQ01024691.1.p1 GENE.GHRQ01024691.1~~GHRQ01024691.1.p1  ORF type:complete len:425 (+),score=136.30 GHRQ01024691.1:465-1739(+)